MYNFIIYFVNICVLKFFSRKDDYYNYFVNLGVQNCKLLTEDFLKLSFNNQLSLDIVSILATPPNTNTGVRPYIILS